MYSISFDGKPYFVLHSKRNHAQINFRMLSGVPKDVKSSRNSEYYDCYCQKKLTKLTFSLTYEFDGFARVLSLKFSGLI
uniref:Uncharacterized protein n=1 Tax=Pararge aegeria TaxID=116150 RepID=S4PWL8_9NEOP